MVARSGALTIPLGPGPKASQPEHHHPPQRYKSGVQSLCSLCSTEPKAQIRAAVARNKCHLLDERAKQISLDVFVAWADIYRDLPAELLHLEED